MEQAHILIVDDSPLQVLLMQTILVTHGYEVQSAGSGEDALAILVACRPDLVLLDLVLPGLSGIETYQRIRAIPACRTLPIIMVTGLKEDEQASTHQAGMSKFLTKPPSEEELISRVRAALQSAVPAAIAA